ncbi:MULTISPECIES: S49 family peptidase [unclassified Sphingopyxis]|uniref:S49 family peptidase n=1 Tax=unclassified Sphingopyxis TaxID=2614943 RepID=UPI0028596D7A|nr:MULTISPECIES: S49 family peptidase [unclassified Sphingopyxis]MDR7062023.1 signal peptide peptidase SppA [Sphingopyxis sp. BE235]MDR7182481.1 signal peptide peptidase SppA [Sphingopyxis sp. BE249]
MTSNAILARFAAASAALVSPLQQAHFESCAGEAHSFLVQHADKIAAAAQSDDGFWPEAGHWMAHYRPYKVVNGTLFIPIKGILLHSFPYSFGDWATGYEYISRALARGLEDGNVRRIALLVDSPGGEVAGCFECAEKIFDARDKKPIEAFAHESAYSAAYALASAASKITVSRTGGVGSIGVVTSHLDLSKRMEQIGAKITFIFAGKHKVDGNSYEALPEAVRERIQVRIDELYGVFVSTVARHRSIEESDVRETEALTFTATEAMSNGLADAVGPLDEAVASFEAELSTETENETMSTEQDNSAASETALAAARTEGTAAGRTEGAKSERERITAIKGLDEAKARPAAAEQVAMATDMSVEQAKAFLAGLPEETKADDAGANNGAGAGASRFDAAMNKDNPNLTANDDGEGEDDDEEGATAGKAGATALLGARRAATGFGRKPAA